VLDAIKDRGSWDTATRTLQRIQSMFSLAMILDRQQFKHNPAAGLAEWYTVPDSMKSHFPALAPEDFNELLTAIEDRGGFLRARTRIAIELQMLTALRPGELRNGEWDEIDWDAKQWIIPAHKMKMKRDHIVPLSTQAIDWLKLLHKQTGGGKYLFAGIRNAEVMSDATVNMAVRRLGFKDRHCAHGFRSTFSTWANEAGFNSVVVERQLAHVEGNKVKASYDRSEHIKDRTRLVQAWADWIDAERDQSGKVVQFKKKA
jgi:integrase